MAQAAEEEELPGTVVSLAPQSPSSPSAHGAEVANPAGILYAFRSDHVLS